MAGDNTTTRAVDQYGRRIYEMNEIPSASEGFTVWRGRLNSRACQGDETQCLT